MFDLTTSNVFLKSREKHFQEPLMFSSPQTQGFSVQGCLWSSEVSTAVADWRCSRAVPNNLVMCSANLNVRGKLLLLCCDPERSVISGTFFTLPVACVEQKNRIFGCRTPAAKSSLCCLKAQKNPHCFKGRAAACKD